MGRASHRFSLTWIAEARGMADDHAMGVDGDGFATGMAGRDADLSSGSAAILRVVGAIEVAGGIAGFIVMGLGWSGLNLLTVAVITLFAIWLYSGVRLFRLDRRRLGLAAAILLPALVAIQCNGLQFVCALPVGLYFGGAVDESGIVRIGLSWTTTSFVFSSEGPIPVTSFQLNVIPLVLLALLWRARPR